jgi:hypothetical protein
MSVHQRMRTRAVALAAILACLVPLRATAQDPRWEVEAYGGFAFPQGASAGSRTLPPAGAPLVTSSPIFPGRDTSSWFFGDGAALLNAVLADFDRSTRITPLDAAFGPLEFSSAPVFGVRVRRRLSGRFSLETGVEALARSGRADALPAIVEASRASFAPAFLDLLSTGPFSGIAVNATATTVAARRREVAFTAAINSSFRSFGSLVPYATFGGGVVTGSGALPSATIEGHYRFLVLGELPIDETDRVEVRYARRAAFVGVFGAGVRRNLTEKLGLRIDARVLVGPGSTRVALDARPSSVRGTPAGFVESFTNPAIQFSSDPAVGRRSSLSGAVLQNFETFSGGVQARTILTVGLCRRF